MKTPNTHTEGTKVYSYGTHVATIDHDERTVVAHGKWSATTSAHIAKAARELGYKVQQDPNGQAGSEQVSAQTFGLQRMGLVKEDRDTQAAPEDILPVLSFFATLAGMEPDADKAQKQRERLLFATPGIIRPDNWEALPIAERKQRTDAALAAAKA